MVSAFGFGYSQRDVPAGMPAPPFALNSAFNGLSVDITTGQIVLGNDAGDPLAPGQLVTDREIFAGVAQHNILFNFGDFGNGSTGFDIDAANGRVGLTADTGTTNPANINFQDRADGSNGDIWMRAGNIFLQADAGKAAIIGSPFAPFPTLGETFFSSGTSSFINFVNFLSPGNPHMSLVNQSGDLYMLIDDLATPIGIFQQNLTLVLGDPSVTGNGTTIGLVDSTSSINLSAKNGVLIDLILPGGAALTTADDPVLMHTSTGWSDGSGASLGTLTNAPAVGDPTKWIAINDNGTVRHIPAW